MPPPLELTGERTLPGVDGEQYWFARHEAAYDWVVTRWGPALAGATVVDAGCGEGYGTARLHAAGASTVLALDYDAAVVAHVARARPGLAAVRTNLVALPLRTGVVDLLAALQVVEHLWDLAGFLRECHRVLRPGASLVLTTPNRPVFSPGLGRGERPANPYHVAELDAEELGDLLRDNGFGEVRVDGLHHGDRLAAWEQERGFDLVAAQVAQVTGRGPTPPDTSAFVATCTAADFRVGDSLGAQDLLASAVRR